MTICFMLDIKKSKSVKLTTTKHMRMRNLVLRQPLLKAIKVCAMTAKKNIGGHL